MGHPSIHLSCSSDSDDDDDDEGIGKFIYGDGSSKKSSSHGAKKGASKKRPSDEMASPDGSDDEGWLEVAGGDKAKKATKKGSKGGGADDKAKRPRKQINLPQQQGLAADVSRMEQQSSQATSSRVSHFDQRAYRDTKGGIFCHNDFRTNRVRIFARA